MSNKLSYISTVDIPRNRSFLKRAVADSNRDTNNNNRKARRYLAALARKTKTIEGTRVHDVANSTGQSAAALHRPHPAL
jgi:hypothetical protein